MMKRFSYRYDKQNIPEVTLVELKTWFVASFLLTVKLQYLFKYLAQSLCYNSTIFSLFPLLLKDMPIHNHLPLLSNVSVPILTVHMLLQSAIVTPYSQPHCKPYVSGKRDYLHIILVQLSPIFPVKSFCASFPNEHHLFECL